MPRLTACLLAGALLAAAPGALAGQDLLRASAPEGRPGARAPQCVAFPGWMSVDGRLGAVTLARDGRRAVLGFTRDSEAPGGGRTALRVVDLATGDVQVTVELGDYGQVTDVWPSYEGTRVWVAAEEGGRVLTVDSRTGKLLMMWEVGRTSHQSGAVSGGDRYLYVTNREAGTLTLIDRATVGARTVELEPGVGSLAVSERGRRTVWVANEERDELIAVSGRSGRILARMPSGGREPVHVRVRPGTHEVWVAHAGSAEIVIVDGPDREVVARIPLDTPPGRLAFSDDGSEAYVSLPAGNRAVRVDPESRRVMGPAGPGVPAASLGPAGCGLAHLVVEGGCTEGSLDPWTDTRGLRMDWLDDEEIVAGSLCASRAGVEDARAGAGGPAADGRDPGDPSGETP